MTIERTGTPAAKASEKVGRRRVLGGSKLFQLAVNSLLDHDDASPACSRSSLFNSPRLALDFSPEGAARFACQRKALIDFNRARLSARLNSGPANRSVSRACKQFFSS